MYYHTSIIVSNKIYYCYFVLDFNTSGSSLDLVLHVFNKSESNIFSSITVDSLTFTSLDDLINYPFNILNQQNKIVVLYGSGTNDSKSLNLKRFEVTNLDNTINIQLKILILITIVISKNTIFKQNHGIVDTLGNIYCIEVINTAISIVKFDNTLTKTTQSSITGLTFSSSNYLKLYSSRDRFNSLTYLFLFNKVSSTNYTVKRINISNTEFPRYFAGGTSSGVISFIRNDGTLFYNNSSSTYSQNEYNTIKNNNQLNEIEDLLYTQKEVIVRSKAGNIFFWRTEPYFGSNPFQNLTNVKFMIPNDGGVAFLVQNNGNNTVSTAGEYREFGAGKERFDYYNYGQFTSIDTGNNVVSLHATYGAFAALTSDGKIKSWGQYSSNQDSNKQSRLWWIS